MAKNIDIKLDELARIEFSRVLKSRQINTEIPKCVLNADIYKVHINEALPSETTVRYSLIKDGDEIYKAKIENQSVNAMTWHPNVKLPKISDNQGQLISDMLHSNIDEVLDSESFRRVLESECK